MDPPIWTESTRNWFSDNSKKQWLKKAHERVRTPCVCTPEDGCGSGCLNRYVFYSCNKKICNAIGSCQNRPFNRLQKEIEVIRTNNRGFGLQAKNLIKPNEPIVEYIGEVITKEELQHRMEKNGNCSYVMSYGDGIFIDAIEGGICRFVNHSCDPNCRMEKWVVSGKPRVLLVAIRQIKAGQELTYDYDLGPCSTIVQQCLCGSPNCRDGPPSLAPVVVDGKAMYGGMEIKRRRYVSIKLNSGKNAIGRVDKITQRGNAVELTVCWFYTPKDLELKDDHYGEYELIETNHSDIVDCRSVDRQVKVDYWDTHQHTVLRHYYYRQTYDFIKGLLTFIKPPKTYCCCNQYENPEIEMIQCGECEEWLFPDCVQDSRCAVCGKGISMDEEMQLTT